MGCQRLNAEYNSSDREGAEKALTHQEINKLSYYHSSLEKITEKNSFKCICKRQRFPYHNFAAQIIHGKI